MVAVVSKNVEEFWNLLPDFVCNEKITSATYASGKIRDQKIVESIFTSGRKTGSQREITSVDGKPAKKNAKMPGLPVNMSTGFGFTVTIGKYSFWLPQYLRTDLTERDPEKTGIFLAEYSNCRKFGAEVTILP